MTRSTHAGLAPVRAVILPLIIGLLGAGCATSPPPQLPSRSPSPSGGTGLVEVELVLAPGAEQFFASQHRARVVAADGTILADWEITDAAPPISVPAGTHRLQAFTVFLSDFIQCSADPSGQQHCAAPTLGPSQVCEVPIAVVAGATVGAQYHSLAEGRCDLVMNAASLEAPPGSPGVGTLSVSASG
jgi:hypothetical protein